MKTKFQNFRRNAAVAAGSMALTGAAFAQEAGGIDTSGVVSAITSVGVAAAAIGVAVLLVKVGIKAYKMVAGAL